MSIAEPLSEQELLQQEYDRTVREDIEKFRDQAQSLLDGKITDDELRPHRLRRGIYSQRQPGVQMVRCKIPGGLMTTAQVNQFARIADEFGGGRGHLTTRQNMQYHFVPLASPNGAFDGLAATQINASTLTVKVPAGRVVQDYVIQLTNGDGVVTSSRTAFTITP